MLMPDDNLILTIPELRLCLNVLGCKDWDDLPLINTGEPPEQRIMNAFVQMIQKGCFLSAEDGYQMEPCFEERMLCIGQPARLYRLHSGKQICVFLYEKDGRIVAISPDQGNFESIRLSAFSMADAEAICSWFADADFQGKTLDLCEVQREQSEYGQYDPERLALFFVQTKNAEDDESDDVG